MYVLLMVQMTVSTWEGLPSSVPAPVACVRTSQESMQSQGLERFSLYMVWEATFLYVVFLPYQSPGRQAYPRHNLETHHYLSPKATPFFRGRELLDPSSFLKFLFPNSVGLSPVYSSPLSYYGSEYPIPGYPSNPRMLLARLYLQLGNFLDYYTGEYQRSISESLRAHLDKDMNLQTWSSLIPSIHQPIFPQLNIPAFPPTFFIHGSQDTAVPVADSYNLHQQLQSNGIFTTLKVCAGMEHSFDYQPDAEQRWSTIFDEAFGFLKDQLHLSEENPAR
jgi:acetyl esterase/lipase